MGGDSMKIERKNWEGCPHSYHLKYPCPLKFFNVPKETLQNTERERESAMLLHGTSNGT